MADVKPTWPSCEGMQYASPNDAGHYISVHFDENNNEIPADQPMHENSTPGLGSFGFGGGQYQNEFRGGYGVAVGASSPSRETTTVDTQKTHQAKE